MTAAKLREGKRFHLGDVLSITTGHLLSPRHMEGVYEILNHMTGDQLFTHQLPRASRGMRTVSKAAISGAGSGNSGRRDAGKFQGMARCRSREVRRMVRSGAAAGTRARVHRSDERTCRAGPSRSHLNGENMTNRELSTDAAELSANPLYPPVCPKCGSADTYRDHHEGNFVAPECDYWRCGLCDHDWGHE